VYQNVLMIKVSVFWFYSVPPHASITKVFAVL